MPEEAIELLVLGNTTPEVETCLDSLRNSGTPAHAIRIDHDADQLAEQLKKKHPLDLLIYTVEADALEVNQLLALLGVTSSATPVIGVSDEANDELRISLMKQGIADLVERKNFDHLVQVILREYKYLNIARRLQSIEHQLEEAEERCDALTESSRDAIAYVHEGMHVTANRAYLELFGLASEEEIEGLPIMDMIAPSEHAGFKKVLRKLSADSEHSDEMKTTCLRSDGAEFSAELHFTPASIDGEPCTQVVFRDQSITREVEEKLRLLSTQDVQTGLYNRQYFLNQLEEEVRRSRPSGTKGNTLYYVTLDNFTEIRSKTGIKASDSLLLEIAGLLRKTVASQEVLARFGDHTFTILSQETEPESAEQSAKRICDAIESNKQSDQEIQATCSIGVVFCSEEFSTGNDFITHAYQACEVARSKGGNSYYIAEEPIPTAESGTSGEADLSALIRFAFDNDKFQLAYQPIVSLHGDTRENYAVTLRLLDEQQEEIQPDHFLSKIEEMGRMHELDRWVIKNAIDELAKQRKQGKKINFLVNISGSSLDDETLLLFVCDCLRDYEAKGSWITFQFDDGEARSHLQKLKKFAEGLKKIKCKTCIDHFGLAKKPEAILSSFPLDFVQFHSSFLSDLSENQDKQDKLNHLNELVQAEDIKTIASGVEEAGSLAILWSIGINYIRGYFIQEPSDSIDYDFNSD
ncbi:MAG: EAL domain-containing protein [Candidatus Thiodiazotropha taylori]|nr:EAL domain-containing protein [Candidatus Thiodiazotropha taylori]MCG8026462.1 EAL domain-containing protein [Candidatus Thiodiazotropha taylori]MCG8106683.1 EAL domain-containing protein [Candidatus Thiodiazotropha taylori]MCG8110819.1 EAL domain-containing protein [Candidatus Thiodiazotropha taylori]MCW4279020.1 EAL domain-containing protein [Candidatus Thiodiazotropha taylori]